METWPTASEPSKWHAVSPKESAGAPRLFTRATEDDSEVDCVTPVRILPRRTTWRGRARRAAQVVDADACSAPDESEASLAGEPLDASSLSGSETSCSSCGGVRVAPGDLDDLSASSTAASWRDAPLGGHDAWSSKDPVVSRASPKQHGLPPLRVAPWTTGLLDGLGGDASDLGSTWPRDARSASSEDSRLDAGLGATWPLAKDKPLAPGGATGPGRGGAYRSLRRYNREARHRCELTPSTELKRQEMTSLLVLCHQHAREKLLQSMRED